MQLALHLPILLVGLDYLQQVVLLAQLEDSLYLLLKSLAVDIEYSR